MRIRSGVATAGFLAAALGVVGLLTSQAADAPLRKRGDHASTTASAAPAPPADALPAGSGHGQRVAYSLGRHRVWLVDADEHVRRTFLVRAGSARPATGTHRVFAREAVARQTDGARAEHVVLFATSDTENIGFSALTSDSASGRAPEGTVRESRADAAALWRFAPSGAVVTVVP